MEKERIADILENQIDLLQDKQKEIHGSMVQNVTMLEIELSKQIVEVAKLLIEKGAILAPRK